MSVIEINTDNNYISLHTQIMKYYTHKQFHDQLLAFRHLSQADNRSSIHGRCFCFHDVKCLRLSRMDGCEVLTIHHLGMIREDIGPISIDSSVVGDNGVGSYCTYMVRG